MHGIVSLLDEEHTYLVKEIWASLDQELGVRFVRNAIPYPHFSYHVAAHFEFDEVSEILRKFAGESNNFRVKATGLGIFNTPKPVIYIPVAQSQNLATLHQKLWMACANLRAGVPEYYHPYRWLPHITLAQRDIVFHQIPGLMRKLNEQPINWDITVNNLAMIEDVDGKYRIRFLHSFKGG
jgi:2'-5' RNA ligase